MRTLLLSLITLAAASAADFVPVPVFQYRVDTNFGDHAYLWVPADCADLAGILLCGMTDAEFSLVRHPDIREACARQALGIVWFNGGIGSFHDDSSALSTAVAEDKRQNVDHALASLAAVSGYAEVEHAPWIAFGHSTGALGARNLAYWRPERTIAVWYFKAGDLLRSPGAGWEATVPGDETAVADRLHGIPVLGITGEYEEFGPDGAKPESKGAPWTAATLGLREELRTLRANGSPAAQVVDPGAGHHTLSEGVVGVLAAAIDAYVPLRVPADTHADTGPVNLLAVDTGTGYLSDSDYELTAAERSATATVASYVHQPDDPEDPAYTEPFWHPTLTLAEAIDDLHYGPGHEGRLFDAAHHGVDFVVGERPYSIKDPIHAFQTVSSACYGTGDAADGSEIELEAAYRATEPQDFNDTPPTGWSVSGLPITWRTNRFGAWQIDQSAGYDSQSQSRTVMLSPRRDGWGLGWHALSDETRKFQGVAPAGTSAGTTYRHSERTLLIGAPSFTDASTQTCTDFAQPADRSACAGPEAMTSTWDSGLPPVHFVAYGPAQIRRDANGDEFLHLTEVPRGARFPVEVAVVSYQWGSLGTTAPAAETRTFELHARKISCVVSQAGAPIETGLRAWQEEHLRYDDSDCEHRVAPLTIDEDVALEFSRLDTNG
ncbi:MAG: hypothetical protein ACOCZK_00825 [Planctomycetota bacterium]